MGIKGRKAREQKRENYATKHSAEKRKQTLIAVAVFAVIAVIVGYSVYLFLDSSASTPGGPAEAGALGSAHTHTGVLVNLFGDTVDFSAPTYQIKSPWVHFEARDGTTIHKHATGITFGYLFESLAITLDDQCFVFPDNRDFCTDDKYTLKFFINGEQVTSIIDYEPMEEDRLLIMYGAESDEEIESYITQLASMQLSK